MNKVYVRLEKPQASKINWTALTIFILNAIANEQLWRDLLATGVFVPQTMITLAIQVASGLILFFRTWRTQTACTQPGPDSPPDVYLDEHGKPIQTVKGIRE